MEQQVKTLKLQAYIATTQETEKIRVIIANRANLTFKGESQETDSEPQKMEERVILETLESEDPTERFKIGVFEKELKILESKILEVEDEELIDLAKIEKHQSIEISNFQVLDKGEGTFELVKSDFKSESEEEKLIQFRQILMLGEGILILKILPLQSEKKKFDDVCLEKIINFEVKKENEKFEEEIMNIGFLSNFANFDNSISKSSEILRQELNKLAPGFLENHIFAPKIDIGYLLKSLIFLRWSKFYKDLKSSETFSEVEFERLRDLRSFIFLYKRDKKLIRKIAIFLDLFYSRFIQEESKETLVPILKEIKKMVTEKEENQKKVKPRWIEIRDLRRKKRREMKEIDVESGRLETLYQGYSALKRHRRSIALDQNEGKELQERIRRYFGRLSTRLVERLIDEVNEMDSFKYFSTSKKIVQILRILEHFIVKQRTKVAFLKRNFNNPIIDKKRKSRFESLKKKRYRAKDHEISNLQFLSQNLIKEKFEEIKEQIKLKFDNKKKLARAKYIMNRLREGRGGGEIFGRFENIEYDQLQQQQQPRGGFREFQVGMNRRGPLEKEEEFEDESENEEPGMEMIDDQDGEKNNNKKFSSNPFEDVEELFQVSNSKKREKKKGNTEDDEVKRRKERREKEREKQAMDFFENNYGDNIFLMDFFKALEAIRLTKEWIFETSFKYNVMKRARRTKGKSKKSRFDFKIVKANNLLKEKIWNMFYRKYKTQFMVVQDLKFSFSLEKVKEFLYMGDYEILQTYDIPNLVAFIFSKLRYEKIEEFLEIPMESILEKKKEDEENNLKKKNIITRIDEELDPQLEYNMTTNMFILLKSRLTCHGIGVILDNFFYNLRQSKFNNRINTLWQWAKLIARILKSINGKHLGNLPFQNEGFDLDRDFLLTLPGKNPYKPNEPEFFVLLKMLFPDEIVTEEREMKLIENMLNNEIEFKWILMETLFRQKWLHERNLQMLLNKYLESYSNRENLKKLKAESYIIDLIKFAREDYTIIDELFGKKDIRQGGSLKEIQPLRISFEQLVDTIENQYKIVNFRDIYVTNNALFERVGESPIPLNMVNVKFLQCLAQVKVGNITNQVIVQKYESKKEDSSHIQFLDEALQYLKNIKPLQNPISSFFKLRRFFRNKLEKLDKENALEIRFLFFIFDLSPEERNKYHEQMKQVDQKLKKFQKIIKNANNRLKILSFVSIAIRKDSQEHLDKFLGIETKGETFGEWLNSEYFHTAKLFDVPEIDSYITLRTYNSFHSFIVNNISNKNDQFDQKQYIDLYQECYKKFKEILATSPRNLEIKGYDRYFRGQIDRPERITAICAALEINESTINEIIKLVKGFQLVEAFYLTYPPLKEYCDFFNIYNETNYLNLMGEFHKELIASEDKGKIHIKNLDFVYVNKFYKSIATKNSLMVFIMRSDLMFFLNKYKELLVYIKEKGDNFFENIRTEVDENDVDDFVKVVSVIRHLGQAIREEKVLDFISKIAKPKIETVNKLVECLSIIGPRLGQIKESALRANQSSANDYENILIINKRCKIEIYYSKENLNYQCDIIYSKGGSALRYRFKAFEELFKKEQILKDSEFREGIVGEDDEEQEKKGANPHSVFVEFATKTMRLLKIVNQFKKIGFIHDSLAEICNTFGGYDKELLFFENDFSKMRITVSQDDDFLAHFKEELMKLLEKCKSQLYEKYSDSEYANLTYFYGARLYELTKYIINPDADIPQIKELFKEIGPDYDPINEKEVTREDFQKLNNLAFKIEVLSKFLKVSKNAINSYDIVDPISQEKKVSYFFNFNQNGEKIYDLMKLILFIMETHHVTSITGSQFLLCSQHTTEEEIIAFCYRSLYSKSSKISFIINPENLSATHFNILRECYEDIFNKMHDSRAVNVLMILSRPNKDYSTSLMGSQSFSKYLRKVKQEINNTQTLTQLDLVNVIHSEYAGLGKTTYIKRCSKEKNLIILFLTGELSMDVLDRRLINLELSLKNFPSTNLHIKLDTLEELEHSNGIVDFLLFQICFLKRVQTKFGCLDLRKIDDIYIEAGNTLGISLLSNKFSCLTLFQKNWIKMKPFDIDDLIYVKKISSPHQIVAFYLNAIDGNTLDHVDIQNMTQPFGEAEYRKIMRHNFMRGELISNRDSITYSQYSTWIKICHKLFTEFDNVKELNYNQVKDNNSIRLEIGILIRDFASKLIQFSVEQAKSSQNEFYKIKKDYEREKAKIREMHEKFENMKKWDASEYLIPFFRDGRFMIFYKDESQFKNKNNLKFYVQNKLTEIRGSKASDLKKSLKSKDYLKIYENILDYKEGELQTRSKKFPNLEENRDNESGVEEGYVMTEENNIKSALMLVKAQIGDPIVIMGESGCGKTYFTKFTASCIQKDEIRVLTLHAGVKETALLKFLKECIERAKDFKKAGLKKKVWILFDEFNTSPLQSIVTEIMQDKTCSIDNDISQIPNNMVFVACCNPFQLREKKSELGLIPDTAENRLSHRVYIVLESLLNYVWDFGQLTKTDEKNHIYSIIGAEQIFTGRDKKQDIDFFKSVIYEAHKFVREKEERSGVSLRDIKRVINMVKWGLKYIGMMQKKLDLKKKQVIIVAVLITVNICYGLRLNGMTTKGKKKEKQLMESLYDKIFKKCIPNYIKLKKEKYKAKKIMKLIDKVEANFLNELEENNCIPPEIAKNKPLRENIFTLFACYATLTPLLICGKPGTSKTLCAQIFSVAMKPGVSEKIKSLQLEGLPNSTELFFGGSQTSTDTGIQKVFDRADKIIHGDKNIKDEEEVAKRSRPLIIIDEIGLAELSPHRPLKILHPKLEKKDKEYAFLGVSNWALDLSKMNRVVYLARPDMNYEDLQDTFVSITGLNAERCKGLMSDFITSYLKFREWQMAYADHKNFHGSRDIYSVFKQIKRTLASQGNETTEINDRELVKILSESIERNFSGALYKITQDNTKKPKKKAKVVDISTMVKLSETDMQEDNIFNFNGNERYNREKHLLSICEMKNLYNKFRLNLKPFEGFCYEQSSQTLKRILIQESDYMRELKSPIISNFYYNQNPLKSIKDNLKDLDSRFLLLFTENGVIDTMLIELIKGEFPNKEIIDWRGSRISKSNTEKETVEMLSMMKTYMQNGYIVIMKNVDELFGSLYDLFNQKYVESEGNKYCYLYYGDEKPRAQVHPEFRCIVIIEEDETMKGAKAEIKQPAPFLNRFEKYRLKIVDILTDNQIEKLKEVIEEGVKMSEGYESRFVGLNIEMLASIVIKRDSVVSDLKLEKNSVSKKESKKRLNKLTTSNYLLSLGEDISQAKVNNFKNSHPYDNLMDIMTFVEQSYQEMTKFTVFTFSSTFTLQKCVKLHGEEKASNWEIINSTELMRAGRANRKSLIEKIQNKHILIQFQRREHLQMIPAIKNILDKMIGESEEDFEIKRLREVAHTGAFSQGVIFLIHLGDDYNFETDMNNTGLSFWNGWDNYVIEDLLDSGYSTIDRYFFTKTQNVNPFSNEITETVEPITSLHSLLNQNHGLRMRLFEKYLLKIFRFIDEKNQKLGIEKEMSDISMILGHMEGFDINDSDGYGKTSFIGRFSELIINTEIVKKSLEDPEKVKKIFELCKEEQYYFNYEDKLIQVMTEDVKNFLIRVLIEVQVKMKFSSINRMITLFGYESKNSTVSKMLDHTFDDISRIIKNEDERGDKEISNNFWRILNFKQNSTKRKNPFIHFPFIALQIEELLKMVMDSDETMNSLVKELKDLIDKMITDEEFSENEANKEKYIKLQDFLMEKVKKITIEKVTEIELIFKKISKSKKDKDIFKIAILEDLVNEYFRNKSNDWHVNPSYNEFIFEFLPDVINSSNINKLIRDTLFYLKVYEGNISDMNTLLNKLRVKVKMEDLTENRLSKKKNHLYDRLKHVKNSILIRLVFDSSDEKSKKSIDKILQNIEKVEFLEFKEESAGNYEEVTTKENVKILRIILNMLNLVKRATGLGTGKDTYLNKSESIKINDIFEKSKEAFNPNKYRFDQFKEFFYTLIKSNIDKLTDSRIQEEFTNLFILFNEIIFFTLKRVYRILSRNPNSNLQRHIEHLFSILLLVFNDPDSCSLFNAMIQPKKLHKLTNHLANCIYEILDSGLDIDELKGNSNRWVEPEQDFVKKNFVIFLDQTIIDPALNVELNDLNDHETLQVAFTKSLSDAYTKKYEEIIKEAKKNDRKSYQNYADYLKLSIFKMGNDKEPFSLSKIKRIAFIRAFMDYDFCTGFKNFGWRKDFEKVMIENILLPKGGDENTSATFGRPEYISIFYLMNNFNMIFKEGLIEDGSDRAKSNDLVYRFVDITSPKKSKNPIVIRDERLRDLQTAVNQAYEKNKLLNKTDFLNSVPEVTTLGVKKDLLKYIIGVVLLNVLTKSEEEEGEEEKKNENFMNENELIKGKAQEIKGGKETDYAFMRNFIEQDRMINSFGSEYQEFLKTLVMKDYKMINKLGHLPNFEEFLKVIIHFGLLLISFKTQQHRYQFNHVSWAKNEINATLLHIYPQEDRFVGLISKLIFVHETRMKESAFERYYKDIGIYECSCGLSYSLQDCGMASVEGKCTKCGQSIGGTGHKHIERKGHFHYKDLPSLNRRISELYEKEKGKYWVSNCFSYNCDEYKNYDYFEGKKDRVYRILCHLYDHIFLLLLPIVNKREQEKVIKNYNDFFKNDTLFGKELKKLNNIVQNDWVDYFLAHILYDIEQVKNNCNVSIKDTIRLLNESIVILAEEMSKGKDITQVVSNNITGGHNLFAETNQSLTLLKKRLDDYQQEEVTIEKKALDFAMKRLEKSDIRAFLPVHYKNSLFFRNFPKIDINSRFEDKLKEFGVMENYTFLPYFINKAEVLPVYADIVSSHLELVNELNSQLGGKYTKEQARTKTLIEIFEEAKDAILQEKYYKFSDMWKNVIPAIKEKHSAMFNIAFMCQRNLDPDAYFEKLTKPQDLTLMDLILINSDTNEGIFMLGIIQTLLKWQENMLTKARECLNRPRCPTKIAQKSTKEDLLTNIDYRRIIRDNTFFNLEFNKENQVRFNLDKIEKDIASLISENRFILAFEKDMPNCIEFYKFDGEISEDQKVIDKVIPRIERIKLPSEIRESLNELHKSELDKMKDFISSLCVQLFNNVIYNEHKLIGDLAHDLKDLRNYDISLIKNVKLGYLSDILKLIKIKTVDELLIEKELELNKELSKVTKNVILNYFRENTSGRDNSERISDIIIEIKVGLFECFQEQSKYGFLLEYGLLDVVTVNEDEEFSEFLSGGGVQQIMGNQTIEFLAVLRQAHDDSL